MVTFGDMLFEIGCGDKGVGTEIGPGDGVCVGVCVGVGDGDRTGECGSDGGGVVASVDVTELDEE
jgi:hypothetical protein